MLLNIVKAKYLDEYRILVVFNNREEKIVDLKKTIFNDSREIFKPLREKAFFQKFKIKFNTIEWQNELDLAPEFLYEIGQSSNKKIHLYGSIK
jgi:hypothetical protein